MFRVRVLGQLTAEVGGTASALGGRRQRAVLARLLVARGAVVSTDRIIDDLWRGEPPARAIASLQTYVSHLRRALEPHRSARSPARVLVTAPPGYAFRADDDAVDAWRFERLVASARAADPARALDLLDEALGLWRGPAYAEFADEVWAATEAARLAHLRRAAAETLVPVAVRAGRAGDAVSLAEALVAEHPLREESWRLLAVALWGTNRSAEALATLRRARDVFAAELGLDPAPVLTELERDILHQRPAALEAALAVAPSWSAPPPRPAEPVSAPPARPREEPFVGRVKELDALLGAADEAYAGGPRLVLLDGEPGIGKSSLMGRLAHRLAARGWLVGRGRCPDDEGTPAAYAWAEAMRALAAIGADLAGVLDGGDREADDAVADDAIADDAVADGGGPVADGGGPVADAAEARFRRHRRIATSLHRVAEERPLAVLLDDLHHADAETLALMRHVTDAACLDPRAPTRVLLVAAFRSTEAGPVLRDALADLATRSPVRLSLAGLDPSEVDQLVADLHDAPVDAATRAAIADRTGGNPFYVRETVHLLAGEGALVAVSEVPAGVRDVIRRRLARLPRPTVSVLGLAAVIGDEFDVDLVVDAAGIDPERVLNALEAAVIAGLLREPGPGRLAFAHALVRDTAYTGLTRLRRARLHARVADALARARPHDHPALAHHLARAASTTTAARAVHHAVLAAERAERGHAHDSAVALLVQAVEGHDLVPPDEAGDRDAHRVALLGRLVRAQVRAGAVADARASRDRAVAVAEVAGRDDLLVAAFTAWTEPTPWVARPYGVVDRGTVDGLERLLRRVDLEPATRCRLLASYVTELAGEGDPRAGAAAEEAVRLARRAGDPALLALALFERARDLRWDTDADRRAILADEIDRLAIDHHLAAYGWRARYIAATAAAARGDVAALRRHVDHGLDLARRYQMAEPLAVGLSAGAMLAHVAGRFDEAERGYAEAAQRLARSGSPHAAGFEALATVTIRVSQGRIAEYAPAATALVEAYGPAAVDVAVAALAAAGDRAAADRLLADAPRLRPDFYLTIFATLRAGAAVGLGRRDLAEELYAALLPAHDQVAGAASTSLAMRPVAHTLADLAAALGRTAAAAEHLDEAVAVATRWRAPVWLTDARQSRRARER
jgi:DNA-binding SARP family transcriptional activator